MSEVLEKNTEIEAAEKAWDLRPLVATDMGAICKIISAIGIRQFKECFKIEDFKGIDIKKEEDVKKVGFGIIFDIAGIIISNIPRAEEEIQAFLASVTGMKVSEVKKMSFADYCELIMAVVMKEDFQDFFKRVMKLFNR